MFSVRKISQYETTWIKSQDFYRLFSQLTKKCSLLSDTVFEEWFKQYTGNPNYNLFGVLQNENVLVGIGVLWIETKYYNLGKVGHIEDIVIDKNFRHRNLGTQLIQFIQNYANAKKCYKLLLHTTKKTGSFYKKLGFKYSVALEMRF